MKQTVKIYTYAHKWSFDSHHEIKSTTHLPDNDTDRLVVPICEHEFTVDIPEIDGSKITDGQVDQLKTMGKKILAENHVKLQKIDDEIASLLALESNQ